MANEEQRYIYMENVLQQINRDYISLCEYETRRNNVILNEVLNQITEKMKNDALFAKLFKRMFYGGSYFDGLNVAKPNEYDLDLVLNLPKSVVSTLCSSEDIPGYVQVEIQKNTRKLAEKLSTDNFLSTSKVLSWVQGVLTVAVNEFPSLSEQRSHIKKMKTPHGPFYLTVHHKGPAFTLKLKGRVSGRDVAIDIDLVPCFAFPKEKWLPRPCRQNPCPYKYQEFFIVPKKPNNTGDVSHYWRLSFQEQERFLISGLQNLKPSLRLLKSLRDINDLCIASYYIKTVFLWEVRQTRRSFWKQPLSYVFMTMLKRYQEYIQRGAIPYFWDDENNLIEQLSPSTIGNISNRLQRIINDIENHPEDPERVLGHFAGTTLEPTAQAEDF